MSRFKVGQQVCITSAYAEAPHWGTVTAVEAHRFKVTWNSDGRKRGAPRERYWYTWEQAHHFKTSSNLEADDG